MPNSNIFDVSIHDKEGNEHDCFYSKSKQMKIYCSSPGKEYEVHVTLKKTAEANTYSRNLTPDIYHKISLWIDGIQVGYCTLVKFSQNRIHRLNQKYSGDKAFALKFTQPDTSEDEDPAILKANVELNQKSKIGKIEVFITHCKSLGPKTVTNSNGSQAVYAPTLAEVPNTKKFWQRPSLCTTLGSEIKKDGTVVSSADVCGYEKHELKVGYHDPLVFQVLRTLEDTDNDEEGDATNHSSEEEEGEEEEGEDSEDEPLEIFTPAKVVVPVIDITALPDQSPGLKRKSLSSRRSTSPASTSNSHSRERNQRQRVKKEKIESLRKKNINVEIIDLT